MKNYFILHQLTRAVFLVSMVILSPFILHSQNTGKKISINLKEATLKEFVKAIEDKTDFSFIYSEDIQIRSKISLKVDDKTIEEILKQVFLKESVEYKIVGKHILLQKTPPKPKSARRFTIRGTITDRNSSETLIGANVYEIFSRQGTTTNPYGFYTLTLPEGEVKIGFSYLGYASQVHTLNLNKDTILNIQAITDNQLEEVLILSDRVEAGLLATHTGALDIPLNQVRNTPTILGEADVMKTIQHIPGVQSGVEGSAGIYVRGGSPDQNLILLDGVPIYNVDHLLGFFSVFTPEATKKVSLFKSSFPARFGGRLSSVIDVRTNDGDMKKFHGTLSLGLLSTKLHFEGPIIKDRTSFHISLRRTYLDVVTKPFMDDDSKGGFYFYDINAKVNHKFSDRQRLYLGFYNGRDYYNYKFTDSWGGVEEGYKSTTKDEASIGWGNTVATARWNYIINNKLFSNTTFAFNQYKIDMDSKAFIQYKTEKSHYHSNYNSGIRDLSVQMDFDYTPLPQHHIKFGGNYIYHNFKPEVMTSKVSMTDSDMKQDTLYRGISNSQLHAHEFSLYAEDNFDVSSRLRINAGVHISGFHVQKKSYFSIQPRLSARYQPAKDWIIKASYSKMNQYINLLTSAPISMPTDLWVPVTKNIKPMNSHQEALGVYYTGLKGWEFSMEAYYKNMNNILEYKDATRFIGSSSSWEEKVEMGKGRSFGVELMAQKTVGKTTGWLSYTWAKSDRKFKKGGINDGHRFPFKYDRRHTINLILNHKFSEKIDIGASWTFATGGTTTIAQEVTSIIRPNQSSYNYYSFYPYTNWALPIEGNNSIGETDYVESRNNYRLPASHRLNIGINFHKKTKNGIRTWNFSLYNVYNMMNPTFIHRTQKEVVNKTTGDIEYVPVLKKLTLLPIFPSVTYTYRF